MERNPLIVCMWVTIIQLENNKTTVHFTKDKDYSHSLLHCLSSTFLFLCSLILHRKLNQMKHKKIAQRFVTHIELS